MGNNCLIGKDLSLFNIFTDPVSSIIGAVAGYLFLWVIYQLFKLLYEIQKKDQYDVFELARVLH